MGLFEILLVLEGEEMKFTWSSGKDQVLCLLLGDLILLDKGMGFMS